MFQISYIIHVLFSLSFFTSKIFNVFDASDILCILIFTRCLQCFDAVGWDRRQLCTKRAYAHTLWIVSNALIINRCVIVPLGRNFNGCCKQSNSEKVIKFLQGTIDGCETFTGAGVPDTNFTGETRTDNILAIKHYALHVLTTHSHAI